AAAANSGLNTENKLRQGVNALLTNPSRIRGFSPDVVEALTAFRDGDRSANAMRAVGNLFGGGGGLGAAMVGAVADIKLPGIGFALKYLGNRNAIKNFDKIDEMVRANSPLGRAMGASLNQWGTAAQSYRAQPSIKAFVSLNIASRNLANTL